MAEVFLINTIAPMMLNSRLLPFMKGQPNPVDPTGVNGSTATSASPSPLSALASRGKYIVNVSSMEGKFTRFKSANHPHTNMYVAVGLR